MVVACIAVETSAQSSPRVGVGVGVGAVAAAVMVEYGVCGVCGVCGLCGLKKMWLGSTKFSGRLAGKNTSSWCSPWLCGGGGGLVDRELHGLGLEFVDLSLLCKRNSRMSKDGTTGGGIK